MTGEFTSFWDARASLTLWIFNMEPLCLRTEIGAYICAYIGAYIYRLTKPSKGPCSLITRAMKSIDRFNLISSYSSLSPMRSTTHTHTHTHTLTHTHTHTQDGTHTHTHTWSPDLTYHLVHVDFNVTACCVSPYTVLHAVWSQGVCSLPAMCTTEPKHTASFRVKCQCYPQCVSPCSD
jgi:hypothetical protein